MLGAVRVTARYRAPAGDGEFLAIPPLAQIAGQLAANAQLLAISRVQIGDVSLPEFRRNAVAEVIEASRRYLAESNEPAPPAATRLLAAGHQPEFFHPGVWVKNFALNHLAARTGHAPLNLVVDNDTVRATSLLVPVVADLPEKVQVASVAFDRSGIDLPYEEYHGVDRGLFESFPTRIMELTRQWSFKPIVESVWPKVCVEVANGTTVGEAVSRVRRGLERQWGVTNFELPVSRLAKTRSFARFVHSILSDLPRFRENYNGSIRAYRDRNGLRGKNHPAPELAERAEMFEAPFWAWRVGTRRERLFVRQAQGQRPSLMAGETPICDLADSPSSFADCLARESSVGWQIRPRALTLTLFVRLCLADGFIHGIGGGKYDEVTDDIIRRVYGVEPPGYAVVTATHRLPIARFPSTLESLRQAERQSRDLEWNPQQFSTTQKELPELVRAKANLIASEPAARGERRAWFRKLQDVTRDLRAPLSSDSERSRQTLERVRAELSANQILASREYSWLLFPEERLREMMTRW
jgi:hypothetical protein